ncbi:type IX secretion system motor protein PorM/GldM [Microscilla marina]|nr:gliding motility protein GldM [Microscilla marina]
MAGEKLSPRQQMIGLMYLVLMAMLALQVSSSIMDKFIFLNSALEHSLTNAKKSSDQALEALKRDVKKNGNSRQGLERIKRAELLKKKTSEIIGEVTKIKQILIKDAGDGIDSKTHVVKNPKEEGKVGEIMIGESEGKGEGYKLKDKLDKYVAWLSAEFKDLDLPKFEPLAEGNKKKALYANDPIQKNKDFAEANFGHTPVVAALAVLTQKQSEILRYQAEVLKKLGAGDLTNDLKFDKVRAGVSVEAKTVAPGDEYKAELFISASASKAQPKMTLNGSPIPVNDGIGKVSFKVSDPGGYTDGRAKGSWEGTVTFKSKGRDTTFRHKEEYTIVQPVLLISSATINPLYRNCANPLVTSVPALGAAYSPSFQATNGSAIPGAKKGDVTIFPGGGAKTRLTVSSNGTLVGSKTFDVLPVPPPTVMLANRNGGAVNIERPLPAARFQVIAKADDNFKKALPKEATYRVTGIEVTTFRGGGSTGSRKVNGGAVNVRALKTRRGDGVMIKVLGVQRVNSRGSVETAPIRNRIISFRVR